MASAQDANLLKIYHGSTDASWNPEPTDIPINNYMQANLETTEANTSFLGVVSYGIAEHCNNDLICDPNFQFYVYVDKQHCTVDKEELSNGFGWKYFIDYTSAIEESKLICTIKVTSEEIGDPSEYGFSLLQNLSTEGIRHWENFEIDGINYLLSDNSLALDDSDFSMNNLFEFDADIIQFKTVDRLILNECNTTGRGWIFVDHVFWWKHFQIDNRHAIIMANNYSLERDRVSFCTGEVNYFTKSNILWWDGEEFDDDCGMNCDNILTDSPVMIESYKIGNDNYLAVAETGKARQSTSAIYKWNGSNFEKTHQPNLQINHADYIETFQDNQGITYLLFSRNAANEEVLVYQVDPKGQLLPYQNSAIAPNFPVASQGYVNSSLVFKSTDSGNNVQTYLILASSINKPVIYRWEYDDRLRYSIFKPYQQLPAEFNNASMLAQYLVNDQRYIAAAMGTHGAYGYQWNATKQHLEEAHAHVIYSGGSLNIQSLTPFSVTDKAGNTHLLIALAAYDRNGQTATESPIMRWTEIKK